jgi:dTDP-4-amino-4,6-dideoxygalactose transaminase
LWNGRRTMIAKPSPAVRPSPARLNIPFNRPSFEGREQVYIAQAIANGHISGDGPFTKQCQAFLEQALGAPRVLLTTSGTHALEMAALLLDIRPGDEVIVPSFTFVSTVNAFVLRGARPVFADVRPDTLNLDETRIEPLITQRTKAIVPVHYAGVGCELRAIGKIAARHGLAVVEDNAHGLFGKYRGRYLGTFGALAALSFHETKNFYCGEGGALIVNDPALIDRADVIREKGTNRARFLEGRVDKYTWVDVGSSWLPSDLLAAFLYAQLEAKERILEKRKRVWERYHEGLSGWAAERNVRLPVIPKGCRQSYHMYYLIVPSSRGRTALIRHLKSLGILGVFHYLPLHLSEMGKRYGGRPGDCPVTEHVSERLIRLPFYNNLDGESQERVIRAIREFLLDPMQ